MSAMTERIRRTAPHMLAEDAGPVLELCAHTEKLEAELAALKATQGNAA